MPIIGVKNITPNNPKFAYNSPQKIVGIEPIIPTFANSGCTHECTFCVNGKFVNGNIPPGLGKELPFKNGWKLGKNSK